MGVVVATPLGGGFDLTGLVSSNAGKTTTEDELGCYWRRMHWRVRWRW